MARGQRPTVRLRRRRPPVWALAALAAPALAVSSLAPPASAATTVPGRLDGSATSIAAPNAGVPSDATWISSDKWATWSNNGYTVANDVWGSGAGAQTIWARSGTNWGVVTSQPTGGVKSYPHTGRALNRALSSLKSLNSSFNVSVPGSGAYSSDYDIWANNYSYEVMIWMNQYGPVGPIAGSYDSSGKGVPNVRNLAVGGHTFNVYRGSNGSNAVFSFVRTGNTNSGTVDVRAVLNWLRNNGWWGDVNVGEVQYGFEISGSASNAGFTCNNFSISYS